MGGEITLEERSPTADEYRRLRAATGWDELNTRAAATGLRNSLYAVCAVCDGQAVGCGRVVGDGGAYFYVQDVIVLAEHRGQGIGRRIMDAIIKYLDFRAEHNAFVGLMAARGAAGFYERYGFERRADDRPGMFRVWGQ
jgi:ribosomal protein S18 acetylase RimI-like enzyme